MKKDEGNPEAGMQKEKGTGDIVVIQFDGIGAWTLDYPKRGRKVLTAGMQERFNIRDRYELHALLQILKQVNNPKVNTSVYIKKGDPNPYKERFRFSVVSGLDNLPEVLRGVRMGATSIPTKEEEDAIKKLVPDYFDRQSKR